MAKLESPKRDEFIVRWEPKALGHTNIDKAAFLKTFYESLEFTPKVDTIQWSL